VKARSVSSLELHYIQSSAFSTEIAFSTAFAASHSLVSDRISLVLAKGLSHLLNISGNRSPVVNLQPYVSATRQREMLTELISLLITERNCQNFCFYYENLLAKRLFTSAYSSINAEVGAVSSMSFMKKSLLMLKEFENTDKIYQDFYTDDNYYVNIHFIYINKNKEIEKIKEETFLMNTPNMITRDEIIGLLKKNTLNENRNYSLLSLLKFNLNLEPEDIPFFLSVDSKEEDNQFLIPIQHIDTITFQKTIAMFQDLNSLYFIFLERSSEDSTTMLNLKKNLSKKIFSYLKNKSNKRKTKRRKC
jgi:hypothetical protein